MTEQRAIATLARKSDYQTAERALKTLIELGDDLSASARPALLSTYARFDQKGRDGTGEIRAAVLDALRPIVTRADIPLLEQALNTYNIVPAAFNPDYVVGLRASALYTLNAIDDQLAGWYAVRLLTDPYASKTSGEPALTAVRVLAAQQNRLPLYQFALDVNLDSFHTRVAAEVLSECLATLYPLPPRLLTHLLKKYAEVKDDIVQLGLLELMVKVRPPDTIIPTLTRFIHTTENIDLFRYAVHIIIGSRHIELIDPIMLELAAVEAPNKRAVVNEFTT